MVPQPGSQGAMAPATPKRPRASMNVRRVFMPPPAGRAAKLTKGRPTATPRSVPAAHDHLKPAPASTSARHPGLDAKGRSDRPKTCHGHGRQRSELEGSKHGVARSADPDTTVTRQAGYRIRGAASLARPGWIWAAAVAMNAPAVASAVVLGWFAFTADAPALCAVAGVLFVLALYWTILVTLESWQVLRRFCRRAVLRRTLHA